MFGTPTPGFDGDTNRRTSCDLGARKSFDQGIAFQTNSQECDAALDLLAHLTKSESQSVGIEQHLANSRGLLFMTHTKAGAAFGYSHAHGFVIFKTANGGWSAPGFVRSKGVSVGLTLGYTKIQTLVCLHSDKAVQRLKSSKESSAHVGVDFNLAMVTRPRNFSARSSLDYHNLDATGFAIAKGWMADVSLKGTELHHDMDRNAQAYSSVITLDHILDGHAPHPRQFEALYRRLEDMASHKDF